MYLWTERHDHLTARTCIGWRKKRHPEQMNKGRTKRRCCWCLKSPTCSTWIGLRNGLFSRKRYVTSEHDENTSKLGCPIFFRQTQVWDMFQQKTRSGLGFMLLNLAWSIWVWCTRIRHACPNKSQSLTKSVPLKVSWFSIMDGHQISDNMPHVAGRHIHT